MPSPPHRLLLVALIVVAAASITLDRSPDATLVAQEPKVSQFGEYRGFAPVLYSDQVRTSFYLPLRDGTRLAMDLYRPALNGVAVDTPHPVLWQHALNRRMAPDQARSVVRVMPELTKYGYVVAVVERRGLGASFGARRGYNDRTEARDAYEVTEWLAHQPWSTGKVGVYGCSNTGDAAMHAASYMPPSLKAVFAGCFSWSKYDGFLRGGIQAQYGVGPERSLEDQLREAIPVDGDESRTLLKGAIEQHREATPLATMWRGMPFRDSWSDLVASRFWLEGSVSTYRDQLQRGGAAFYVVGGWKDDFRQEGLVAWANLTGSPARVVIGPWLHCQNPDFDLLTEALRFFDRYLKGVDNGIDREPPLHLFAMNAPTGTEWRAYDTWPPRGGQTTALFLAVDAQRGEHAITAAAPSAGAPSRTATTVHPPGPCPDAGPATQPCSQAATGLRFTGTPLPRDTEITGHPLADLWILSPRADQHVFAYIEDLAPDGTTVVVSEGRVKASLRAESRPPYEMLGLPWRRSLADDYQPLVDGVPVNVRIDILPLSYVFKTGHRMRLVISANDPRERQPAAIGHTFAIVSSTARPSVLRLPVAP